MQISRVKRPKNTAKQVYDRLSGSYDLLAGSSEAHFMLQGLELLAVQPDERVLEIGCGTGKALVELCQPRGERRKVHALDLSRGMLRMSRQRLVKAGLSDEASLLEGDGSRLPYLGGSFNAVFLSFTLELFDTPDIPRVLDECRRVLVPQGRLGIVSMLKSEQPGWVERLYEWFHRHAPAYVDCRPIDASWFAREAGFSVENRQAGSMWGLPVEILVANKT